MADLKINFESNIKQLKSDRKTGADGPVVTTNFRFESGALKPSDVGTMIEMQHEDTPMRIKIGLTQQQKTEGAELPTLTLDAVVKQVNSTRKRTKAGPIVETKLTVETTTLGAEDVGHLAAIQEQDLAPAIEIVALQQKLPGT